MNIETANRLVQLRKQHQLSQEQLAAKLGLSRQAVSKWERAEASPDTDNLIMLARLYRISLDELLGTDTAAPTAPPPDTESAETPPPPAGDIAKAAGIHVCDGGEEVHVTWKGIHVADKHGETVHVAPDGIYVAGAGEKPEHRKTVPSSFWKHFPYPILTLFAFFIWGFAADAFGVAWLVFLTIPLYYTLVDAIQKRDANHFAFPVLAALIYLILGIYGALWHPGWIVFLTIPLYYSIVNLLKKAP